MRKINATVMYSYDNDGYSVLMLYGTKADGNLVMFIDDTELNPDLRCHYQNIKEMLITCEKVLRTNGFYVKNFRDNLWCFSGIIAIEATPFSAPHRYNISYPWAK